MSQRKKKFAEDSLHVAHIERSLRGALSSQVTSDLRARERAVILEDERLSRLDKGTMQRLFSAIAKHRVGCSYDRILELVSGQGFFELPARAQRRLLDAVLQAVNPEAFAADCAKLCSSTLFAALDPRLQESAIQELVRRAESTEGAGELCALLALPGFASLTPDNQYALFRYLRGPSTNARTKRTRGRYVEQAWNERRDHLAALLNEIVEGGESRVIQTELLYDFIHAPSQNISFFKTMVLGAHVVIAFGDSIEAPPSISYGQRRIITPTHKIGTAVESPSALCSTVDRLGEVCYERTRARISRAEELMLIEWIEHNHMDETRAGSGIDLFDSLMEVLIVMTSRRGKMEFEHVWVAGHEVLTELPSSPADRACDDFIAQFLAA